jgi:outer membrane lipoprotein SlyB
MKSWLTVLMVVGVPVVWAQQLPDPNKPPAPPAMTCSECGVVTSIRSVTKQAPPVVQNESKPSGLVATIPLGSGSAQVGSSTKLGRDVPSVTQSWEVIVRLDDGRYRVVVLDAQPNVAKGDRVRVDEGKIVPP